MLFSPQQWQINVHHKHTHPWTHTLLELPNYKSSQSYLFDEVILEPCLSLIFVLFPLLPLSCLPSNWRHFLQCFSNIPNLFPSHRLKRLGPRQLWEETSKTLCKNKCLCPLFKLFQKDDFYNSQKDWWWECPYLESVWQNETVPAWLCTEFTYIQRYPATCQKQNKDQIQKTMTIQFPASTWYLQLLQCGKWSYLALMPSSGLCEYYINVYK